MKKWFLEQGRGEQFLIVLFALMALLIIGNWIF